MKKKEYKEDSTYPDKECLGYKIGDRVQFLRQCVGYPTKFLEGDIVGFNYKDDNPLRTRTYVAHIKSECEYGSGLPYNHTEAIQSLRLILPDSPYVKI